MPRARSIEDEMVCVVYIQRSALERMALESALKRYLADATPAKKPITQKKERHEANMLSEHLGKYFLAVSILKLIAGRGYLRFVL